MVLSSLIILWRFIDQCNLIFERQLNLVLTLLTKDHVVLQLGLSFYLFFLIATTHHGVPLCVVKMLMPTTHWGMPLRPVRTSILWHQMASTTWRWTYRPLMRLRVITALMPWENIWSGLSVVTCPTHRATLQFASDKGSTPFGGFALYVMGMDTSRELDTNTHYGTSRPSSTGAWLISSKETTTNAHLGCPDFMAQRY